MSVYILSKLLKSRYEHMFIFSFLILRYNTHPIVKKNTKIDIDLDIQTKGEEQHNSSKFIKYNISK